MVSQEHGVNSSSLNADITIVSLKWGTAESAFRLGLSDGSSFFISFDFYDASRHFEGASVSPEEIDSIRSAEEQFLVRRKALDLLSRREHSTYELMQKLCQRGFDRSLAEKVCSNLEQKGLLDNTRFARVFVGARLRRKPEGPLVMERRLRQKGVPREVSSAVIREIYTSECMDEILERSLNTVIRKKSGLSREEYIQKLEKMGFLYRDISEYFEKNDI